jgi:hypothetical protein
LATESIAADLVINLPEEPKKAPVAKKTAAKKTAATKTK